MDSGFKNDQLRRLNLKLGQPQYPHRDEYEQDTVFDYLYEINKAVQQYHEVLESINTIVNAIDKHITGDPDINYDGTNGKLDTIYNTIKAIDTHIIGSDDGTYDGTNGKLNNIYNALLLISKCTGGYISEDERAIRVLNSKNIWE